MECRSGEDQLHRSFPSFSMSRRSAAIPRDVQLVPQVHSELFQNSSTADGADQNENEIPLDEGCRRCVPETKVSTCISGCSSNARSQYAVCGRLRCERRRHWGRVDARNRRRRAPNCLFSQKVSSSERKYSVTEREYLALMIRTIDEFRGYVESTKLTVHCDHSALSYLRSMINPTVLHEPVDSETKRVRFRYKVPKGRKQHCSGCAFQTC